MTDKKEELTLFQRELIKVLRELVNAIRADHHVILKNKENK